MPYRSLLPVILFLFALLNHAQAQSVNIGIPPVFNFSSKTYKGGTQVWDMAQDSAGVMWFANNAGLLEFDGMHWRLYPIDNGTIVRSVAAAPDGRIFVGGQGDFGYFEPGTNGRMRYHSVKKLLLPQDQTFGDVWDVEVSTDGVFFRTDHLVFQYHNGQMHTFPPAGSGLFYMGAWKGKVLIQNSESLLFVFENGQFVPLSQPQKFDKGKISAIFPLKGDSMLITTISNGIFCFTGNTIEPWTTHDDAFLKNNIIFSARPLHDGRIAVGTALNGLAVLDEKRRILYHINKKNGLQNNTVLSSFVARNGQVWLGLDNGISCVDIDSPFTTFFPDGELQGTGYTAHVFNNKIYFGTNTGLYAIDWKPYYAPGESRQISLVANSGGQVWSLTELEGELLMGHHEGPFAVNGLSARKLTNLQGVWRYLSTAPGHAIAGHYNGFANFKKVNGNWAFDALMPGFAESSRLLAKDPAGNVWMAHPYRGIYRLRPDQSGVDFYDASKGLPSELGNNLFAIAGKVVFTGQKGVFLFNEKENRFEPDAQFNQIFGEKTTVKYLKEDASGNIWYQTDQETGVLLVENNALDKKIRKVPIPELNGKLTDGFHCILPVDVHNLFVATGQGFIHFDPESWLRKNTSIQIVLHEVRLSNGTDSVLFGGFAHRGNSAQEEIELTNHENSISFSFAATDYPGGEFIEYAHWLEGSNQEWSEWQSASDLTFNNLPPGHYVFHVKARNQYGVESQVCRFPFTIAPPWYASRPAYFFYILLALSGIATIIWKQQRRFEREKMLLKTTHQIREAEHQLLVQQSEEEINRLQKEKLEAEVNHKNQELASVTLHLVQKNAILNTMSESLEKLREKVGGSPELQKEVARIARMLEHDSDLDSDWEHFSQNFDQVHSDFLKRLGERFSNLSPNDYKMCAYLRMNLSSKEIAALMNISLRGVEAGRYRLRKRLDLDTETNLTEFLMRF